MKYTAIATLAAICLCAFATAAPPESWEQPFVDPAKEYDYDTYINVNDILMFNTNRGGFGRDVASVFHYDGGTFYPYNSIAQIETGELSTYALYAAGLWLGGLVGGEIRAAVAEFDHEYVPGPMHDSSYLPDDPSFRVYKLFRDSLAGNPNADYLNWPIDQGAPVNAGGQPLMLGDQMLWTVFNDADPSEHNVDPGSTAPLGIEVQQTVWAYDGSGDDTIFVSNEIPVLQASDCRVEVTVYSGAPSQITGHDYAVEVDNIPGTGPVWLLRDVTLGTIIIDTQTDFSGDSAYQTDQGFLVVVSDPQAGFSSFEVVANTSGPIDPPESGAARWAGFPTPDGPNGDGRPSDDQQVGGGKWLFHTADNGGSSGGGNRGSFEQFLLRITRGGINSPVIGEYDYEMRFTGSNDILGGGGSYVIEYYNDDNVFWVPFELWRTGIGTPNDPSDDVRLFPFIIDDAGSYWQGDDIYALESWGNPTLGGGDLEHSVSGGDNDPWTDWVYWRLPDDDSPGESGYNVVEAEFLAGTYSGSGEEVMARTVLVNWNGGEVPPFTQDCPEQGTVFRLVTSKAIEMDTYSFTPTAGAVYTTGPQESSIYFKYKLYNKGYNDIEDFYVAIWTDIDLGGATDDLTGCDTLQNIFYSYNGSNFDAKYGPFPPSIGFKIIHGPVVPSPGETAVFDDVTLSDHANLDMYAFQCYIIGTDPDYTYEMYNYMQGFQSDGSPQPNGTRYAYPGDPVAGTGDLDMNPSDERQMASFGPFDFAPGDSQYVHFKLSIGPGINRNAAITRMFEYLNAEPPRLAALVDPDTLYTYMVNATDPIQGTITAGWWGSNPGGTTIDPATVLVPELPIIDSIQTLSGAPGFDGEVVRVHFPVKEFILAQGAVWDYEHIPLTVTGSFTDGSPLSINTEAIIGGHVSGDVTGDGVLDISDLISLASYMFQSGPMPRYLDAADVDANDVIDIGDIVYLVTYMFQGGPPPHCE